MAATVVAANPSLRKRRRAAARMAARVWASLAGTRSARTGSTNWQQIFAVIPDLRADVPRCAADGSTVWSEWEHRGTRPDGSAHVMRGVAIFGVEDGVAAWSRFYLEPVGGAGGGEDADQFRRRQLGVSP